MQTGSSQHDLSYYVQTRDAVGVYLAQRDVMYPKSTFTASELCDQSVQPCDPSFQSHNHSFEARDYSPHMYNDSADPSNSSLQSCDPSARGYNPLGEVKGEEYEEHIIDSTALYYKNIRHPSSRGYESYNHPGEGYPVNFKTVHHTTSRSSAHQYHPYPITDRIRHLHTLHSLLSHINPRHKLQALHGPAVHVVERVTSKILAHSISKSLLVLFLGHEPIRRFIRTVGLYDTNRNDLFNRIQELCIPLHVSSSAAIKILLAWMKRAYEPNTMDSMYHFSVPQNTFAACTLA
jgi:hypothetical protein